MATLNNKKSNGDNFSTEKNSTVNHEEAFVHKLNNLEILLNKTQGSYIGESTYYESRTPEDDFNEIKAIIENLSQEDAEYALKIAAIGRASNMISYPLAILTACYNDPKFKGNNFKDAEGRTKLTGYTDKIVRRAKDVTEILANQIAMYSFESTTGKNGKAHRTTPLPIQERKQLKRKLEGFDEYQIAKALSKNRNVSMADAIKLLHPAGDKCEFFGRIIEGKVRFANGKKQVQSELSKLGTQKSSVENIKASLKDTPLMVIVKNLVAMLRADALDEESVNFICKKLSSKEAVEKSHILPYQLFDAYIAMKNCGAAIKTNKITNALVKAIDLSVENVEDIEGTTVFLVDLSASMNFSISRHSSTSAKEIAALLAAIGAKKSNCEIYAFANSCEKVDFDSASTVVDIAKAILSKHLGGGTYIDRALKVICDDKIQYEHLVILSDNDCYSFSVRNGLSFNDYRGSADATMNSMIRNGIIRDVFLNNLAGNNFAIANTDDYRKNLITGFSEKFIDSINFSILLRKSAADIRNVIDLLYEKYYGLN